MSGTIVVTGLAPDRAALDQLTCSSYTRSGERPWMPAWWSYTSPTYQASVGSAWPLI